MFTLGFTPAKLADHFKDHVIVDGEFPGVTTAQEYERLADAFVGGPLDPATTLECFRTNGDVRRRGDRVRYNQMTGEFGVLGQNGVIKTYFKPSPSVHQLLSNIDYFWDQCK